MQANDFWQFSCELYAKEGVAKCCLLLQDTQGCNVNLFLLCLYCSTQKRSLSSALFKKLVDAIANSETELKQHRAKRIAAKALPTEYARLKQQELTLEKQQQAQILQVLNGLYDEQSTDDPIDSFVAYYALDESVQNNLIQPVKACCS